ncbi:calcium-binding protein [Streptomyces collinus]|uniref:calcium-binding protein n=1 Tax=Streptomyces collinus TaxID=42684 RepID=UPI0036988902
MTTAVAVAAAMACSVFLAPTAHGVDGLSAVGLNRVVVNGGDPIVIGVSDKIFPYRIKVTHSSGISSAGALLWHGPSYDNKDGIAGRSPLMVKCPAGATVTCAFNGSIRFADDTLPVSAAGVWKVAVGIIPNGSGEEEFPEATTVRVLRRARLTADASPEPVRKGRFFSISGTLTRADWKTRSYKAYSGKSVKLQFRKSGTATYTTVKTLTSGASGALKTTVTAQTDGYWRFVFTGSSTTSTATAPGDFIDVQ